jgi:hypothetical protein
LAFISLVLISPSFIYGIDASERTSAIEERQRLLDRFCIGICPKGPIGTNDIQDGAVTTPKLADKAVTGDKIEDNTISGIKIYGLSKLIFSTCTIIIPELAPGQAQSLSCNAPSGAESGDKAIGNLQQVPCCPAPVFVGATVFQQTANDLVKVLFGFVNSDEDEFTIPAEVNISFMIFDEV